MLCFNLIYTDGLAFPQSTDAATEPPAAAPTSDSTAGPRLVIWGTDVVVQETQDKFKRFLQQFIDENAEGMGDDFVPNDPLYMQKLEEVLTSILATVGEQN